MSKLTNVSKVTIYKKLKLKEISAQASKKEGVTYVNEVGFNLIKLNLKGYENNSSNLKNEEIANTKDDYIEPSEEDLNIRTNYINHLKIENKHLWDKLKDIDLKFNDQLLAKDLQINNLNERLKQEQDLNKNSQILLKDKPEQDILLLEEHFLTLDTKLEEVKTNMLDRKEQQHKSIFNKIFKK